MHQRQAIRDAVIDLLKGNTVVGDNVSKNIVRPLWRQKLPQIVVYTLSEEVEEFNTAPRDLKRTLLLAIEVHETATDNDELQDTIDDIAKDVEDIMYVDHTLSGTCEDQMLQQVEMDFNGDGDQPIAICRMIFSVYYLTAAPGSMDDQVDLANIQDFTGANVEYNIGHNNSDPDDQVEAEDEINLED